ncbi:MAG: glycosyltransferase [Candidatus Hydrogenedentes bacterium]|nr:glycosyltransferase [Candidatus Hydrogenedentota bacterium]
MTARPLKILITDPHLKGGGQVRYIANLARELTRLGHSIIVGCKPGSVLVDCGRQAGAPVHDRFRYRGGLRPRAWLHDLRAARAFIAREAPDILHANGSQDHWISALANRTLGAPVCMVRTRHNTYPVHDAWPNRLLNRHWTDYQIVVCETVRARLAQQRAFDAARMRSLHNGVDPAQFHPDPEARARARAAFGYTAEHVVLGMAARLVIAKGHRFLFEAAPTLRLEFPNLRILLLGQGVLENSLKQSVRDAGLDSIVTFAGFRDDMPVCIQAFDIGVQPSIDCEASSFSLMEQMATEKPIVTSDHGGSKEIVRDGLDGFVVPAGTVDPLADALRALIAEPGRRIAMGRSARERILSAFTLEQFAARTVDAYREALDICQHRRRNA